MNNDLLNKPKERSVIWRVSKLKRKEKNKMKHKWLDKEKEKTLEEIKNRKGKRKDEIKLK